MSGAQIRYSWCSERIELCLTSFDRQTSPVLIKFNVFVDTFFVFEIMFNFIVGTWYKGAYQVDVDQSAQGTWEAGSVHEVLTIVMCFSGEDAHNCLDLRQIEIFL